MNGERYFTPWTIIEVIPDKFDVVVMCKIYGSLSKRPKFQNNDLQKVKKGVNYCYIRGRVAKKKKSD